MPELLYPWMHLVGRVFFSLVFILSGLNHFMKLEGMAGYAAGKGLPAPKAATVLSGAVFLVGGVLILLGWYPFVPALLIALFTFLTAVLMHQYWKETDEMAKMNEMNHFLKDLALSGAALLIAFYADQTWPLSLGG